MKASEFYCTAKNIFNLHIGRRFDFLYQNKLCRGFGAQPYFVLPVIKKGGIVYSGGAGMQVSFEQTLSKIFDTKIFLFDPTPTGKKLEKEINDKNIIFLESGLAGKTGDYSFSLPKNPAEGSYTISVSDSDITFPCISVSDFCKKHKHDEIEILKLDIEGFEYGVLHDVLSNNMNIKQITLEFHGWMRSIPNRLDTLAHKKLRKHGYVLVYRYFNDFTYARRDVLEEHQRMIASKRKKG